MEQQNSCSMKAMTYSMPLLSAWISFSLPAAVGVYWIYRSIAATLQQFIMSKIMPMPTFTAEDYKAAEKEVNGSSSKKKKKNAQGGDASSSSGGEKKRSLHHIDDDDDDIPAAVAEKSEKSDDKAESETDAAEKEDKKSDAAAPVTDGEAPVMKDDKGKTKYEKK